MEKKNKKYPQVRIPIETYEDIKRFANRKEISISETIVWAWNQTKKWKKNLLPSTSKMRERLEKELRAKIEEKIANKYRIFIEEKNSDIEFLKNMINDAKYEYDKLLKEKEELEKKLEDSEGLIEMLKKRIDELEKYIKEFQTSNAVSLKRELENKNYEINNLKMELLDLRNENDSLRKDRNNQVKEIKWIRDTISSELKRICKMESALDIKPALLKLREDLERKIKFELEKYQMSIA